MAALPGFGATGPCWKCRGAGVVAAGRRKRAAGATGACRVCGGSGALKRGGRVERRSKEPGRLTQPRSSASTRRGPRAANVGEPGLGEELCCLCGSWRVFQRVGGHRYSTEDVVTAHVASQVALGLGGVVTHVDLGCGVGSVLQMVAWRCTEASYAYDGVGIEAQADSANLARRSVTYNGAPCAVLDGDLRRTPACTRGATLVTGTPPYFDVTKTEAGAATTNFGAFPACEQSAGARYEFRGGIEAYCKAAADVMAPSARFVVCEGGLHVNLRRVQKAAEGAGLVIVGHRPVVGRAGKPTLFGVWTMRRLDHASGPCHALSATPLVVRDRAGRRTTQYEAVLRDMAMM